MVRRESSDGRRTAEAGARQAWLDRIRGPAGVPALMDENDLDDLGGRFHLIGIRGEGSEGRLYEAHDGGGVWAPRVLLRLLPPAPAVDESVRDAVAARIVDLKSLDLPGLWHPDDVILLRDRLLLVYPWQDAESLADLIRRRRREAGGRGLDWPEIGDLLGQMTVILRVAHMAGWVHGGLFPGNVYVEDRRILIRDLGLSGLPGVLAVPPYASPQSLAGAPACVADDIHALGWMVAELAGATPVPGRTRPERREVPALDRRQWRGLCRALAPAPGRRPADMPALVAAMQPARRRPGLWGALAAVMLAALVGGGWWLGARPEPAGRVNDHGLVASIAALDVEDRRNLPAATRDRVTAWYGRRLERLVAPAHGRLDLTSAEALVAGYGELLPGASVPPDWQARLTRARLALVGRQLRWAWPIDAADLRRQILILTRDLGPDWLDHRQALQDILAARIDRARTGDPRRVAELKELAAFLFR